MTELESHDLYDLARALYPTSKPEIIGALIHAVEMCPPAAVKQALQEHLQENEFLKVPEVMERIRRITGVNPARDHVDAQRAARRAESERWQREAQADYDRALAFCWAQPTVELARMRTACEGRYMKQATERWAGRQTLECRGLVLAIYAAFGKAGVSA